VLQESSPLPSAVADSGDDPIKLPHLSRFRDRLGKWRYKFRRAGQQAYIQGQPDSPEFMAQYHSLLSEARRSKSTAPRPVLKRRYCPSFDDRGQPLVGVYLLMFNRKVVYVGSSLRMPQRVADHRSNGRPFDEVFYIATTPEQRKGLEKTLIRTINPLQNTAFRTDVLCGEEEGV